MVIASYYPIERETVMLGQTESRIYFKVSSIDKMVEQMCEQPGCVPDCLENDDMDEPLEVVLTLNSQVALNLAYMLSEFNVSTAIQAFCKSIYRELCGLPEYAYDTDVFFKVWQATDLIDQMDHNGPMDEFFLPEVVACPLEIVISMTRKFATSITRIVRQGKPIDMLFLLCNQLEQFLEAQKCHGNSVTMA